jgi:hypothetical protein
MVNRLAYLIPVSADIPELDARFLDYPTPTSPR